MKVQRYLSILCNYNKAPPGYKHFIHTQYAYIYFIAILLSNNQLYVIQTTNLPIYSADNKNMHIYNVTYIHTMGYCKNRIFKVNMLAGKPA